MGKGSPGARQAIDRLLSIRVRTTIPSVQTRMQRARIQNEKGVQPTPRVGVRVMPLIQTPVLRIRPLLARRRVKRASAILLFKKVETTGSVGIAHIDPVFFSKDRQKEEQPLVFRVDEVEFVKDLVDIGVLTEQCVMRVEPAAGVTPRRRLFTDPHIPPDGIERFHP